MWAAYRKTSWLAKQKAPHKQIEFGLDRTALGTVRHIASPGLHGMVEPMRAIDVETAARREPRDGRMRAAMLSLRHDAYEVLVDRMEADIAARWKSLRPSGYDDGVSKPAVGSRPGMRRSDAYWANRCC